MLKFWLPTLCTLTLLSAATTASAADTKVYRCGDTYSQVPCGNDASQPKLYGTQGGNASAMEQAASCAAAIAQREQQDGVEWALQDATEPVAELVPAHGSQVLGYRIDVVMTQTTLQGQPLHTARYRCAVSQDLRRVLSVQALP